MSTDVAADVTSADSRSGDSPELTILGKRLEILRIERGVSKQRLAERAGTSRQQLWRVMTGKSELTTSLRDRLAMALAVDPSTLSALTSAVDRGFTTDPMSPSSLLVEARTVTDFLSDPAHLLASLRTLPAGDGGRRIKRALLNAVEDLAVEVGHALPRDLSEIRRRVLAGEL